MEVALLRGKSSYRPRQAATRSALLARKSLRNPRTLRFRRTAVGRRQQDAGT